MAEELKLTQATQKHQRFSHFESLGIEEQQKQSVEEPKKAEKTHQTKPKAPWCEAQKMAEDRKRFEHQRPVFGGADGLFACFLCGFWFVWRGNLYFDGFGVRFLVTEFFSF